MNAVLKAFKQAPKSAPVEHPAPISPCAPRPAGGRGGSALDVVLHRLAGGRRVARPHPGVDPGRQGPGGRPACDQTRPAPGGGGRLSLEMATPPAALPRSRAASAWCTRRRASCPGQPGPHVHPRPGRSRAPWWPGSWPPTPAWRFARRAARVDAPLDKGHLGTPGPGLTEASRLALAGAFADRAVARNTWRGARRARTRRGRVGPHRPRPPDPTRWPWPARRPAPRARPAHALGRSPQARRACGRCASSPAHPQIRAHLAHLGHPICGDRVYGPQALAAWPRTPGPSRCSPASSCTPGGWPSPIRTPASACLPGPPPRDFPPCSWPCPPGAAGGGHRPARVRVSPACCRVRRLRRARVLADRP
jgi:hypothetical protein